MNHGDHWSFQKENLVATVWQDNKPVLVLSTNWRPDATVVINRRHVADTIHVDQPENVFLYNKNMNMFDRIDQLRAQYNVGRFSVKAWKYLLWFFVNSCIVNAYILYTKNIHQKNQEKIHQSGLSTRSGTWFYWSLFSMEVKIKCWSICRCKWSHPWKCLYWGNSY